jgi:arylsulfatase A-like enzyme
MRGTRLATGAGAALAGACLALAAGRIAPERSAPPELKIPERPQRIGMPASLTASNPHNLVVISIDTLRADHLSLYGYGRDTSPALDAFAADALVFESAWSQSPKTAESHMTLFTGLYPLAHGVRNLRDESESLSEDVPTLAAILRRAGYRTAAYHGGGNLDAELGFDRGFDSYERPGDVGEVFARGAAWLEDAAGDPGRSPFFLLLHTKVLHDPYEPPPAYAALFADPDYAGDIGLSESERRRARSEGGWWLLHRRYWERVDPRDPADVQHLRDLYDALIRLMDDHLASFLERYRELGFGRNTLVVFTSDHGEEFLEHRGFRHGSVYREVLHVPLVLRLPEADARGRRVAQSVGLVDVLPTLLDWLGLPTPEHVQGSSFAALLGGAAAGAHPVYSEWAARGVRALRIGDWKYVNRRVAEELYDLAADPDEQRDLLRRHPEIAARLRRDAERMAAAGADFAAGLRRGARFGLDPQAREQLEALGYLGGGN